MSEPDDGDPFDFDMQLTTLHGSLVDPVMASMNFLNEVSTRFPNAISFAAGRPLEDYFDCGDIARHLEVFIEHLRNECSMPEHEVRRTLFQYGRTKGIIHELVRRNLEVDEGIKVPKDSIVVTVGCQEAMFLVLRALRATPRDVVLAISPTYVGLTGAARLVDCPVMPVRGGDSGIDFDDLAVQIAKARAEGFRPRALYIIPDVANPTGISIDLQSRRRLLQVAKDESILLLEDNAYGIFAGAERVPSLKALDTERRVVRLGSFAKSVLPGARVGYVVADQRVLDDTGVASHRGALLADHLSAVKSMLTVNTSPVTQAIIGGALIANGHSLLTANREAAVIYGHKLQLVLDGLASRFPDSGRPDAPVRWNTPRGGFFVSLTLPFKVDDALLHRSAEEYGVLWTPMSHFYIEDGGRHQMRLSLSQLTPEDIRVGLDRLATLIRDMSPST